MPREERMFGDVVDPSIKFGNKQGYSVALTFALEVLVVGLVVRCGCATTPAAAPTPSTPAASGSPEAG